MADISYNKTIVKNINESLVRRAQKEMGGETFTRTDIARKTGLSFPTVSRILNDMIDTGEIVPSGIDVSTGGRHARSFSINPDYAYVLCLAVGPTIHSVMVGSLGKPLEMDEVQLWTVDEKESMPPLTKDAYLKALDGLIQKKMADYPAIKALSVGVPWGVNHGEVLYSANLLEMEGFPLQEYLENKYKVSVRIENDMNCMAIGSYVRMFHKDPNHSLVCLNFGSEGCGCGVYVRSHLIRGSHGFAGELRYLPYHAGNSSEHAYQDSMKDWGVVEKIAHSISCVCCMVDPEVIVVYKNALTAGKQDAIEQACRKYLPARVTPQIIESDTMTEDYENGLIQIGVEMLTTGYEIVNR